MYRNAYLFERGKKNSSHSHDVLCKGNVLVGYWERKNGCLPRSVFTFHSSPLLPTFSIYSTSFFFLYVRMLLLGRSQLKSGDLHEWPLGSRATRSSSINNGLARWVHETFKNRPSFFLSLSSSPPRNRMIPFHSFKTQHATIIQHSSAVGVSLFGFAATSGI